MPKVYHDSAALSNLFLLQILPPTENEGQKKIKKDLTDPVTYDKIMIPIIPHHCIDGIRYQEDIKVDEEILNLDVEVMEADADAGEVMYFDRFLNQWVTLGQGDIIRMAVR